MAGQNFDEKNEFTVSAFQFDWNLKMDLKEKKFDFNFWFLIEQTFYLSLLEESNSDRLDIVSHSIR